MKDVMGLLGNIGGSKVSLSDSIGKDR